MLDKSIPYKNIIMHITPDKIAAINQPQLPDGYSFRFFQTGDDKHWADIETAVLEFDKTESALKYFNENYLPYIDELKKRCLFVVRHTDHQPVATATAWGHHSGFDHQPALHWVAVHPDAQGKGIGTAIIAKATALFAKYHPNQNVYLHTQTWSHQAVCIYSKLGWSVFKPQKNIKTPPNDYEEAMQILKTVLDTNTYRNLIQSANTDLIQPAEPEELQECLHVIHSAFGTVAKEFGLTKDNCATNGAFMPPERLQKDFDCGKQMFALHDGRIVGFMQLSKESEHSFELEKLAVLPEYRHKGYGSMLLDFAKEQAVTQCADTITIGIIEENTRLKNWYTKNNFVHTGSKKYAHLPFTVGFMEWKYKADHS